MGQMIDVWQILSPSFYYYLMNFNRIAIEEYHKIKSANEKLSNSGNQET